MSDEERPRRGNLMEQRLRRARGEELDDDLEPLDNYADDDTQPIGLDYRPGRRAVVPDAQRGCGQLATVALLSALIALLGGALLLNNAVGGLGRLLANVPSVPDIREVLITPTPEVISGAAILQRVQQLARLETASYTVQTVIEVRQSQGNPIFDFFGGDALLLIAQGSVEAGIDLATLTPDQVTVAPDGSRVTLRLPPAQIFNVQLDNDGTRVYSRERGIFAPPNNNLETLARQEAEQEILRAACEDGVLSRATEQAERSLRQFLSLIDTLEVVVQTAPPAECSTPTP